jgi:urease accessory protein
MGLGPYQAAYVYLFSHVRSVISAAVRASVLGPYQAQFVLGGEWVGQAVRREVEAWWEVGRDVDGKGWRKAGQTAPVMDLWGGRHELLYSRIFNS